MELRHGDRPAPRSAPDVDLTLANAETDDLRWVPVTDVVTYPLHPGFASSWPDLLERIQATLV